MMTGVRTVPAQSESAGCATHRHPRALVLTNPHARRVREQLDLAVDRLCRRGFTLMLATPERPTLFPQLIRDYREQVDLVIVAGGDGALNATAGALVETRLPLGILPLGTANDLARTLSIPTDLEGACDVIAAGHTRRIDLGRVNDTYFFNVASIGLGVSVTRRLTGDMKKRWGVLAYALTALRAIWQFRPFRAEIRCDAAVWNARTVQITVGNGRFYGGGMTIAEHAAIDDQQLDLYSLEVRHWWHIVGLFWALRNGALADRPGVRTCSGREITIHTRRRRRINTDGEITASTPAVFRLIPGAITVFAPSIE